MLVRLKKTEPYGSWAFAVLVSQITSFALGMHSHSNLALLIGTCSKWQCYKVHMSNFHLLFEIDPGPLPLIEQSRVGERSQKDYSIVMQIRQYYKRGIIISYNFCF